jgi:hypothetical protein
MSSTGTLVREVAEFLGPRYYIEPLFGTLLEIRFDLVSRLLYAVVIEEAEGEKWMMCYVTGISGWKLLWLLVEVKANGWSEALMDDNENAVAVYSVVEEEVDIIAVVEEFGGFRTIKFLRLDGEEWGIHLLLRFDLDGSPELDVENFDNGDGVDDTVCTELSEE